MSDLQVVLKGKCADHSRRAWALVVPINEIQMKPCFVMATLIGGT